jgi:2-hydroxy-6-oxonona-2,4-dienedioate hydrolase
MDAASLIFPTIQHRQLQTATGAIHYVEAGDDHPLLLIHGGHGHWGHWIANIDALAQHRKVLALDMPGFGLSYIPERRLELAEYAEAIGSFIEALGLREIAVAGFSFGTLVAATVAAEQPDAVTSLTLINPPGVGKVSREAMAINERQSALAKEHGLRAGVAGTLKELMLYNADFIDEALINLLADCVTHTRYATHTLSRHAQLTAILEKVSQKTMVLLGANDPYQRHELMERSALINRAVGTDCVHIIQNAAHWLQYEQADVFNRTLLKFIDHA